MRNRCCIHVPLIMMIAAGVELRAAGIAKTVNVTVERRSGDKVRGPATVTLTHVNVIRYDVVAGVSASYSAGPDLRVPFIPALPAVAQARPSGAAALDATRTITVENLLARLAALDGERIRLVQTPIIDLLEKASAAKRQVDALVESSDAVLATAGGSATLVSSAAAVAGSIRPALDARWPTQAILDQIAVLSRIRDDAGGLTGLNADQQKVKDYVIERVTTLQQWYAAADPTAERATTAAAAQEKLTTWKNILESIQGKSDPFTIADIKADCGFAFGGNKESKIELLKHDRLAAPNAPEVRQEIVTVVCSSPMSVGAGFGVSSLDNPVYAFVSTAKSGTNGKLTSVSTIGKTENSSFRALPLVLVNTRVWEPCDWFSLHVSAGATVDNAGNVGSSVEYVFGPSFAFSRELFVTLGWHVGYVAALTGGFKHGDPVPEGLSAPPLQKDRTVGGIVSFTYRLR